MLTKSVLLIVGFSFLLVIGWGCNTQTKSSSVGETVALVSPANAAPLDYFEKACARCHGPNGTAYGDSFGIGLTEHELVEVVDEMAIGPANWPLNEEELEIQVAFHRSMLAKTPFIVWNYQEENVLRGEVLPHSTVQMSSPLGTLDAEINFDQWQVKLPPEWSQTPLTLHAKNMHGSVAVDLTQYSYSHHEPLAD